MKKNVQKCKQKNSRFKAQVHSHVKKRLKKKAKKRKFKCSHVSWKVGTFLKFNQKINQKKSRYQALQPSYENKKK